ncbi:MAG TPA: 2-phosphosulfolactate phosphatase [Verrucomicrobiota bacterium]|jgi:2-phosphosulfolactate phosphatase|nr:2-phosphosulfolactate phosphatase [Verrucomicrobiota bacterium]HPY29274.1 2-phosphosulfolactate phosphatase [Verrucomicrobiota bacterium]HQB15153.1 2-phosphosulfolactate phosphatase [Verrucomicrobiota bacterium]
MACTLEVLFAPAEFRGLAGRDLSKTTCVVFDVLRATSTFVTALARGAAAIIPVGEISGALAVRRQRPEVLLAGERAGHRITAAQTGGINFDLGNSPREYTAARVRGRTIVSTTTNGTRALRACAGAEAILVGSFLNLKAIVRALRDRQAESLLLVCAGTGEAASLEDTLAAGALCERLQRARVPLDFLDSAIIASRVYHSCARDLVGGIRAARNASHLLAQPALRADVRFCLQRDCFDVVPQLHPDPVGAITIPPR